MDPIFMDERLKPIYAKVRQGTRLSKEDGICIYQTRDLLGAGKIAHAARCARHGNTAFYVYNQHLNYTNICKNRCRFCAYAKDRQESGAYAWSIEEISRRLMDRIDEPVDELHIVGGLNEALGFDYYMDLLKTVKQIRPHAAIKAFTCVEIDYLSRLSGLGVDETIAHLKEAGLDMMPGGGAEILNTRIHDALFPKKIDHTRWIEIVKAVHKAGITTNATMLYGHIETIEERVDHLITLREIQDETHGFSAFVPLAFHSKNTRMPELPPTTAVDDLKSVAAARLMLDNFDHIKAYWVMIGEPLSQVALSFGADDLDGTIIEERITHTAGASSAKGLTREQMEHMIRKAGFEPVQRDSFYNPKTRTGR
ncbi:aminofutalosine synthase MqnE [Desulfotignum phosphitoxidans]|uniref:Aminodeoxyfutalosine synthase n=1 Tax=Desulfotignum phosphitoxidans DSM 13687 TaxID=1286635 RepID=S0G500_9BACT|nr:aminofutalosine synthase MqnE [Desulfotignum phosphitoxidans]EMS80819.1 cobyrinic acid a,c-diamide synthase [Desulfotignum phosphitoxidans DSM 13687]